MADNQEELLRTIDQLLVSIESFPSACRPYRELFHAVTNGFDCLTDMTVTGFFWRKFNGKLGDMYGIMFQQGYFSNTLMFGLPYEVREDRKAMLIHERVYGYREPIIVDFLEFDSEKEDWNVTGSLSIASKPGRS